MSAPYPLSFFLLSCSLLLGGCGAKKQATLPPGLPPAPETVTKDEPGGNAHDPHLAALTRQIGENFGWRTDKDNQARFPLPDQKNWTRIRLMLIDHFVAFKYGDDQHAVTVGFVVEMPEDAPKTSAACIEEFEKTSLPKVAQLGGKVTEFRTQVRPWENQNLIVRKGTGHIKFLGRKYDAALAWAAYPAYENACMVYAVAIPWDGHRKLAQQARNEWSRGFRKFRPLTEEAPYRRK